MNLVSAAMARLADCHDEVLHEQSPAEARRMRAMAGNLRQALEVAGAYREGGFPSEQDGPLSSSSPWKTGTAARRPLDAC